MIIARTWLSAQDTHSARAYWKTPIGRNRRKRMVCIFLADFRLTLGIKWLGSTRNFSNKQIFSVIHADVAGSEVLIYSLGWAAQADVVVLAVKSCGLLDLIS